MTIITLTTNLQHGVPEQGGGLHSALNLGPTVPK